MTRCRYFHFGHKTVRDALNAAIEKADQVHLLEKELVEMLYPIDQNRFYVTCGYNSLQGYCYHSLKFTKTQAQRIAIQVRRYEPTVNFRKKATEV